MRRWPRWVWLAVGIIGGAAVTAAALRWTSIDHLEAWNASVAMQGWVGSVIGALVGAAGAFLAAIFVLQKTLSDERARFDQQRKSEDERFAEQRALEDVRFAEQRRDENARIRQQIRQSEKQAKNAARAQRKSEVLQKRTEVWATIVGTSREFFWFPVDETELQSLQIKLTSLLFEWEMYTGEGDRETVAGVHAVVAEILGKASRQAAEQRRTNAALPADEQVSRLRCEADDAIVNLGKYGVLMHRGDLEAQRRGTDWFHARGSERPRA